MADPEAEIVQDPTRTSECTIEFYNSNAEDYARATQSNDLSYLYPLLLDRIPSGGVVLDAGSGSGRDTVAFLKQGYRVEAFDASARLAAIATERSGIAVDVCRFEDWIAPEARYDGIWCFASLLHVAQRDLPDVLSKLGLACRRGGWLFASFKQGTGEVLDDRGRRYTNLTKAMARQLFEESIEFNNVDVWEEPGPSGLGDTTTWVYVVAQRLD